LYDDGGLMSDPKTVTIRLTGPDGAVPPDTAAVRTADRVFVRVRPAGDWALSDDAPETLRRVSLLQEDVQVSPAEVSLRREGETITDALVAYPRAEVDWLAPVSFGHEIDTSATTSFPDVYAANYPSLRTPYDRGRALIDDGHPLRALDTLSVFFGEVTPAFEFVSEAKKTLDAAAEAAVAREEETFRSLRSDVISTPSAETLGRLTDFQARLDTVRTALADYLAARPEAGTTVKERLASLDTSAAALYDNAYDTFRRQTVRVFFQKPYTRSKPATFIDVLTRLLLHPAPARAASSVRVDSLPPERLDDPRYAEVRRTLRQERWWQDFQDVLIVVDNNLRRHDRVFGEKVFRSLKLQRTAAAQPYYEILAALDAAAADDRAEFDTQWERALSTCTALDLLNAMEQWARAARTPPSQVPAVVHTLMTDAVELENERRPAAARRRLDRAASQAPEYAPLLYERGRLAYEQGDTTAARRLFDRARTAAPDYTAPAVSTLRLLLERDRAETALSRADSTLQEAPYWLVYFPKARALVELGRYDAAVEVLRGRCEQLNDQSHALYVLLAALYTEQQAWDGVAWAVQQAEDREARRPPFISQLQTIRETVRRTEEASLSEEAGDPSGR
jgi:tetratricopeptide (TPR) repeat protein